MLTLNAAHILPTQAVVHDFICSTFLAVFKLLRLLYTMIIVVCVLILLLANILLILAWINLWRWLAFTHLRTIHTLRALLDDPEFGSTNVEHMFVSAHVATQTETDVEEDTLDTDGAVEIDDSHDKDEMWCDAHELNEEDRNENAMTAASDTDPVVLEVIKRLAEPSTTSESPQSRRTPSSIIRERFTKPSKRRSEPDIQAPTRLSKSKKREEESVAKMNAISAWRTPEHLSDPTSASQIGTSPQDVDPSPFVSPTKRFQQREVDTATSFATDSPTVPTDDGALRVCQLMVSEKENATSGGNQGSSNSGIGQRSYSAASNSSRSSSNMTRLTGRSIQSRSAGSIDLLSDTHQDQLAILTPVLKARSTE